MNFVGSDAFIDCLACVLKSTLLLHKAMQWFVGDFSGFVSNC